MSPEDQTVSSASLCMSPGEAPSVPLHTSTPFECRTLNGYGRARRNDNDRNSDIANRDAVDALNGNINVNAVSESTSMDVLSGGESDAGDTLTRRNNNNSLSSRMTLGDMTCKRKSGDVTYYIAKELLMTERTYKRDLELLTVTWSKRVGSIGRTASSGAEAAALAKACLALEPLALPAGALLARLDRALASTSKQHDEEPEYRKIADLLFDYLSNTYDAYAEYTEQAGALVALVESARRRGGAASREASAFDASSPLPLASLLLRPLHRLLHYCTLTHELWSATCGQQALSAHELASKAASLALTQLRHVENHAALCQLQRDIVGYDKLLVAEREFVRLGCVYRHSSKGLQQRMLFLFSDLLLIASKSSSGQFRAHSVLPLFRLRIEPSELPHSFNVMDEDVTLSISASNEVEFAGWWASLSAGIGAATDGHPDTQLSHVDHDLETTDINTNMSTSNALSYVCWHRATSLTRDHLHLAMRSQLSGYLLRKFKNSHGWQKLWVVFALFTLFFYKSWQDQNPLASLPLLGYTVSAPSPSDGIEKDFVFKLQYKSHVYFFRADSHFTYNRWTDVLQTPMMQPRHN